MCGTATLTKLGILPSHKKRKQHRFLQKTSKQYQSIPLELTPINTLFVTEQEFLRGQHGTSSETGSSDGAPLASPDSVEFSAGIPQFDANTAMVHQGLTEVPISPERPKSVTPRSSNKRFDFSNQEFDTEEETEEDDYMVFEDDEEAPPLSPHSPPLVHRENSHFHVSTEVDNDNNGMMQTPSKDNSSISTKEDSCESSDQSPLHQDRARKEEEEKALIAMRDTILQQQENLQRLAIKNQQYRDRLAESHGRVKSLYRNHLGSVEAIVKLQFERESFEAEAVLLREELKKIRNELSMLHKDKDCDVRKGDLHFGMQMANNKATSEIRWSRGQGSILYHQGQTIDHDPHPVEEPLTPASFSSPSHSSSQMHAPLSNTLDESEKSSHTSRDVEGVQSSSWALISPLAHGRLSSLRSPKHSSSFSFQGSVVNTTQDSETSAPTHLKKTVRFHSLGETNVKQNVGEQQSKPLPSSPTTRRSHAKKLDLATSTFPSSRENTFDERCEVPQQLVKQNITEHTLTPDIPAESPSSGVPDGTSSSRLHEGVDQRRINERKHTAEIAAFIGLIDRDQISPQPSSKPPESPLSQLNRHFQPHGPHHLDKQSSQNRAQPSLHTLRQPTTTDQILLPSQDSEDTERPNLTTVSQPTVPPQSKFSPRHSPRSLQRTWENPSSDGADLQTSKNRIRSCSATSNQSATCDETQPVRASFEEPFEEPLEEPESSEERARGEKFSGPSQPPSPRQPLSHCLAARPSSSVRQRNEDKLENQSPTDAPQQPLSPRSRYLAAVTRPFPANSTIILSKVRNDQGPSARTAAIQPRMRDSSNHQPCGKPKADQSDFWENQRRLFTPEESGEKSKPVTPERHRIEEDELTPSLSDARRPIDPPSVSSRAIIGSKVTTMDPLSPPHNGLTTVASPSSRKPEQKSARTLEDYRDLYRMQNPPRAGIVTIKSQPSPSLSPASPRATHHFPVSPSSDSVLFRKATERVRNREGKDGSSGLKRQFLKVKKQATAPTMSYAEANAELRWVKSQQRILESMKVNVDAKGSRGNAPAQRRHDIDEFVDTNNIEELNKRVNRVRMQLIKVTLEENEEREARDDMGDDRDDLNDLDVHYGRGYGDARERKHTTYRNSTPTRE
jgi:hypothetical protein